MLDCLCERFPAIGRDVWEQRFARGLVQDPAGTPLPVDARFRPGAEIRYFREVTGETPVPFRELLVHVDEHLVVADKPHFLPVTPAGRFVRETLLARLVERLGNSALVPLHRIDRETAGLVMFSACRATRARYQALFRERTIVKHYEALAPALEGLAFPHRRLSRLVPGEPFFRMGEGVGEANSETWIATLEQGGPLWHYLLRPVSGRKHQLRVHMAALGAPIVNDRLYPLLGEPGPDDYAQPLQLLARSLEFIDPVTGRPRAFYSQLNLRIQPAPPDNLPR